MGITIKNVRALASFKKQMKTVTGVADKLAKAFIEEAIKIATEQYAGIEGVSIASKKVQEGVYALLVTGTGLWYLEFGTGLVGSGTYPDDSKKPSEVLEFESPKGYPQSTQGWEYYYDNPLTKKDGGWYYTTASGERVFTTGQKAGAQMYNTAQELGKRIAELAKNYKIGAKQ